jgi:sigma-B regulation protein RsbU (phosphoserine phosphatase)
MEEIGKVDLKDELRDRRRKLETAMAAGGSSASLARLLGEVDAALARMDAGTYGLCTACNENIEIERLLGDPLVLTCSDHLTAEQQRTLEEDLALASRVQSGLLPRQEPQLRGWESFYHYEPARGVGGDYCDLVTCGSNSERLYFLLGDVSGKGMAASMLMSALRAIVRTLVDSEPPVEQLVARANRLFCETALPQHFATLVCGRASASGEIEICNAGHCPPLHLCDGRVERIASGGLPIGLFTNAEYPASQVRMAPGETLMLYSDGLTEARNREEEEYGVDRLAAALSRRPDRRPKEIVLASLEDVARFRAGAPAGDDLTLLAIRRSAES